MDFPRTGNVMAAKIENGQNGIERRKTVLRLVPDLPPLETEISENQRVLESDKFAPKSRESKKEMIEKNQPQAGKSLLTFLNALADSVDQEVEMFSKL